MHYCGAACRAAAFRKRIKERGPPPATMEAPAPTSAAAAVPAEPALEANAGGTAGPAQPRKTRPRRKEWRRSSAPPLAQEAAPSPRDARPRRAPFDQQVLSQAPPEAVAYRLVLPLRSHAEMPKIAPAPDAGGRLRVFSLKPFELPDDIRLRDGHVYRILWVGAQGEPVSPQGTSHLPALHFFLGPADPPSDEQQDRYSSVLRDVSDPNLRKQCEREIASLRLTDLERANMAAARERAFAHAVTEKRFEEEQEEARRRRSKESLEEIERTTEKALAKQEEEQAAQWKAELQIVLKALGVALGIPTTITAIQALMRKLNGNPMDWPEFKERLFRVFEVGVLFLAKAQERAQASAKLAGQMPSSNPTNHPTERPPPVTKAGNPKTPEGQRKSRSAPAQAGQPVPDNQDPVREGFASTSPSMQSSDGTLPSNLLGGLDIEALLKEHGLSTSTAKPKSKRKSKRRRRTEGI